MNWLDKLERKFGRYAIPNLTVYLLAGYVIGFAVYYLAPNLLRYLTLEPYYILHGQIWRLITWVFMPTDTNLVYLLIMALFYYQLGTTLERTWGTFRFNVYIFGGMLFTVIGAFLLYGIMYLMNGGVTTEMLLIGTSFSTSYINMSIFLAFACMYPDMQVLLMFIIPIKMKWMAAVYGVLIALIPAFLVALYFFGLGALIVTVTSVLACVLFEYLIQKYILKGKVTISNGSAILTGVLLAFNVPSNLPVWIIIIGALVAIGIGKMSFGGFSIRH